LNQPTEPSLSSTHQPPVSPRGHHAFLIVTAQVRDPGRGDTVTLELDDGTRLLCKASADALRLGSALEGRWRATLHFTTRRHGALGYPLRMTALRAPGDDNSSYWSVAGKVVRLDRAAHVAVVRVYPERAKLEPFVIAARATLEQLSIVEDETFIHMRGTLDGDTLVAEHFERAALRVPARWADWKPPHKRREINPATDDHVQSS
jgi:hypothetical protein